MSIRRGRAVFVSLAAAAASIFGAAAWAANPASNTTTTGQTLNVQIDTPLDGATVPAGALNVAGRVAIGPLSVNAAVLYIVDGSGSTKLPSDMDCNGDGVVDSGDNFNNGTTVGDTLDCELSGVFALNDSLIGLSGVSAGMIRFENGATQRDVNPAISGTQAFTTPGADNDGNGVVDIRQAGKLLTSSGSTNYDAALTVMNTAFAARPAGEQHVAFFLSDGVPTTFTTGAGSPLAAAAAAGNVVNTYSVGLNGTGCAPGAALRTLADATGGTCTEATDPSTLSNMLPGTIPANITGVTVSIDGGAPTAASLDALGNFQAATSVSGVGSHTVSATVTASDSTTATATVNILVGNPNADLSITKTSTKSTWVVNDTITYHLTVSNAGPATATGVKVVDSIPAGTKFVSAAATQGSCAFATPKVTCNLGTLATGGLATVTLKVKATAAGTIVNSASVSANEPDPTPANSASSVTITVKKRPTALTAEPAILSVLSPNLLQVNFKFDSRLTSYTAGVPGKPVVFTAKFLLADLIGTGTYTCNATTDSTGRAQCELTIPLGTVSTLIFGYDAKFAGDAAYLPSTAHGPIVKALGFPILP